MMGHEWQVKDIIFDTRDEYLLSGGDDGKMIVWNFQINLKFTYHYSNIKTA